MPMTTVSLLLLLVLLFQSVDSQSTTDDETCSDGGLLCKLQGDVERLLDNQQRIFQILQQYQTIIMNGRYGKYCQSQMPAVTVER